MPSIAPGGLAGDRRGVIPASGFAFSTDQIWSVIKENKDLDLSAHKAMVATVQCEEIAHFISTILDGQVQPGLVSGFGKRLTYFHSMFLLIRPSISLDMTRKLRSSMKVSDLRRDISLKKSFSNV